MKKLFLALALACTLQAAFAQKPDADMQKAVDKALAASQDAKKGTKAATWMNLAKAYMAAYANPSANVAPGVDKMTFSMMFKEKPLSVQNVEIQGEAFERMSFSHIDVYFNGAGQLAMVDVTQPSVPGDLLGEAAKAYAKAFELGAKDKDVAPKMKEIVDDYYNDAFMAYSLGDMAKASDLFKGAADVSRMAPSEAVNDDATYNTAFTALAVKNYARAEEYYNKCLANNYTSDGNIYASLSEIALAKADTLGAKNYLATGLTAYPDNASILTSLINLYLTTKEDPAKIVELLDEAKKAMPDNPSLYYVEGNIYAGIKKFDEADAAYNKALEINPTYDMAYYGLASVLLKRGEDLVDEMNALDVREYRKYDQLQAQLIEVYKSAIDPFEKCYENGSGPEVKAAAADFLKRLNFQLRNEDPKYKEAYEKWEAIVNAAE
ncbi:MAG: tetratricopeptide repeat protein [Bacteroidales bacterium]|nr:tetratricopeptide repeat protein [Bacteroidales bacterium]